MRDLELGEVGGGKRGMRSQQLQGRCGRKVLGREPVLVFAGGQRAGPENLHRANIWYVACKSYLSS